MKKRGDLKTEQQNPISNRIGKMGITQILNTINEEDSSVAGAVRDAIPQIDSAVRYAVNAIKCGGRVFYVGAGTSGRLGVLDASEIPPTFSAEKDLFIGIIAGGDVALKQSIEGAEDESSKAKMELKKYNINENDVVIGISCSGAAKFVVSALEYANIFEAKTIYLITNSVPYLLADVDTTIVVDTGPEVITGSTRMKAGTATKMVLNMISTATMIKLGKVYNNLMVDLKTVNDKLVDRGVRIIEQLTELKYNDAKKLLANANNSVKVAVVMNHFECSAIEAKSKLSSVDGFLHHLID